MLLPPVLRCVCVCVRYVRYHQCDCFVSCVLTGVDPPAMWASSLLASQRWMVDVHLSHSASRLCKTCWESILTSWGLWSACSSSCRFLVLSSNLSSSWQLSCKSLLLCCCLSRLLCSLIQAFCLDTSHSSSDTRWWSSWLALERSPDPAAEALTVCFSSEISRCSVFMEDS